MNQPDTRVRHIANLAIEGASRQLRERLDADAWPAHDTPRWLHELVRQVPPAYAQRAGRPAAELLTVSKAWTRVAAIALAAATETALVAYEDQDERLEDQIRHALHGEDAEAVTNAASPAPDEVPF